MYVYKLDSEVGKELKKRSFSKENTQLANKPRKSEHH